MAENKEKVPEVRGPGRGMRGPRPKVENPGKIFKLIMGYTMKNYALHMVLVLFCIVAAVFANLQGTLFTRTLIDSYITPMMGQADPDYGPRERAAHRRDDAL